jgi:DNA-binding MarR family transcriptional regulator
LPSKNAEHLLRILHSTFTNLVRRDDRDLSARQLGVFLTCYLGAGPHTVRGLAGKLNVGKSAITRALDRLEHDDLARRKVDLLDRRSVLVQRTTAGAALLTEVRRLMAAAAKLEAARAAAQA